MYTNVYILTYMADLPIYIHTYICIYIRTYMADLSN